MGKVSKFEDPVSNLRHWIRQRHFKIYAIPDSYGMIEFFNLKKTHRLPATIEFNDYDNCYIAYLSYETDGEIKAEFVVTKSAGYVIELIDLFCRKGKGWNWEQIPTTFEV